MRRKKNIQTVFLTGFFFHWKQKIVREQQVWGVEKSKWENNQFLLGWCTNWEFNAIMLIIAVIQQKHKQTINKAIIFIEIEIAIEFERLI